MTICIKRDGQNVPLSPKRRNWEKDKDTLLMQPQFEMECFICNDPEALFVLRYHIFLRATLDKKPPYEFNAHAVDQKYTCTKCGCEYLFGIATDREHYEEKKRCYRKAFLGENE